VPTDIHVGFVRAVMLGRDGLHRDVLLDIVERAGGADAASYLSTGNVSFRATPDRVDDVVDSIERGIADVVGRSTPVMVRSPDRLRALVARSPFDQAPHDAPRARLVTMVRDVVRDDFEVPVVSPHGDHHVFAVAGGEVFAVTIDTGGRVQDPGGLIERLAGEPVTTRAWGTIERIVAKLS
jgi:uncharacterized protein (DUF1697 family)